MMKEKLVDKLNNEIDYIFEFATEKEGLEFNELQQVMKRVMVNAVDRMKDGYRIHHVKDIMLAQEDETLHKFVNLIYEAYKKMKTELHESRVTFLVNEFEEFMGDVVEHFRSANLFNTLGLNEETMGEYVFTANIRELAVLAYISTKLDF